MMQRQTFLHAILILAVAMLAACGGDDGGGGIETAPRATLDPTLLQGRWTTPAGTASAMTAVIVPDATGTVSAWMLAQDTSRLVKLALHSDSTADGMSYDLGTGAAGQALSGLVTAALTASPKRITFTNINTDPLVLDQSDAMTTPAVQADAAGTWNATIADKTRTAQWTVSTNGDVTGSMTTGCTYAGSLSAQTGSSAYSVQLDESCPDASKTTLSGMATIDASKNRMTVVATNTDQSRGVAVFFTK